MTPTTFDDRARAETQRLLSDATRLPSSVSLDRGRPARWKTFVVFAATVLVIGGAVAGASFALRPSAAEKPAPATHFGRWKAFDLPPRGDSPDAISCPDPNTCVAVDYDGDVFFSTNPEGGENAWTVSPVDPSTMVYQNPNQTMTGVSCADPSLCVAVDESGNVVTSTNPGGGASAWILSGIDGAVSLTGVSCPDEHLCVAVGGVIPAADPSSGNYGVVLTSTDPADGPGTWKVASVNVYSLTAVSCPSPSLCVALDSNGQIVTSTDPTGGPSAWTSFGVDQGSADFSAISCPSAFLCVAVDDLGNVATSTDPTGGSGAWTLTNLSPDITGLPNFDSVSCATDTFCVIGSFSNSVYVTTDPTGGSGAWTSMRVIPVGTAAMFGLSCPNKGFCVGVDGSGGYHVYTNPSG